MLKIGKMKVDNLIVLVSTYLDLSCPWPCAKGGWGSQKDNGTCGNFGYECSPLHISFVNVEI